jgi:hypothetical protein
MADERLLRYVRRFWDEETVTTVYERLGTAHLQMLEDITVIINKSTEGENAGAQVVIRGEDFLKYMDVLEARLREYEAEAAETEGPPEGSTTLDFSHRYISP